MNRPCGLCGADLDTLGKRRDATYCSGACRAAASRHRRLHTQTVTKAHRKRTRRLSDALRVPYSRLVDHFGEQRAREVLNDRQRAALDARGTS